MYCVSVRTKPQEELTEDAKEERVSEMASLAHLRGPYFDPAASKNVTAIVDQTAFLNCRVHNLGNKTASFLPTLSSCLVSILCVVKY